MRSIDTDQKLDASIFQQKKAENTHAEHALEMLKTQGVKIKSDRPITQRELECVNSLFEIATRKGYRDRMKNMTINLVSDSDRNRARTDWNERDRILTIPLSGMAFSMPSEKIQISKAPE